MRRKTLGEEAATKREEHLSGLGAHHWHRPNYPAALIPLTVPEPVEKPALAAAPEAERYGLYLVMSYNLGAILRVEGCTFR